MQNNNQAGKGDKPRPVKKSVYNDNYDDINWGDKPKKKSKLKTIDEFCNRAEGSFKEYLKKHREMEAQSWIDLKKRIKKG